MTIQKPDIALGLLFTSMIAVALLYCPTFRDLLATGGTGEGYTHRIFVIPIFIGAAWHQRHFLASTPFRPCWLGLLGLAAAGAAWLLGELSLTRLLTQLAVIAMIPAAVLTIFGYCWLRVLSFPLFYLLFAVPIRGPIVDIQVALTAGFTHYALLASGVAVHREGPYFELSSGRWSIADACSGIGYLTVCMMLTTLFAWLMYSSFRKRIMFVTGAIVLGVSGNWFRAFLTIWIAHLSDNRILRDDHSTFGWLLFAAILYVYCWVGLRFRDDAPHQVIGTAPVDKPGNRRLQTIQPVSGNRLALAISGVALSILAVWPVLRIALFRDQPLLTATPNISPTAGWHQADGKPIEWMPTVVNPNGEHIQSFEKNGRRVNVYIGMFANENWNSKLVTSVNQLIPPDSDLWSLVDHGTTIVTYRDKPLQVKTGVVVGHGNRIITRQWFWINGMSTANGVRAKFEQLINRVTGQSFVSGWIAVYTSVDSSDALAGDLLAEFIRDMGMPLEVALFKARSG